MRPAPEPQRASVDHAFMNDLSTAARANAPLTGGWSALPWSAKLALVVAFLVSLPIIGLTAYHTAVGRAALIAAVQAENLQRAHGTAEAIDSYLADLQGDVRFISLMPATVRLLVADRAAGSSNDGDLSASLHHMVATQGFHAILIADHTGRVLASSDRALIGQTLHSRHFFLSAVAGQTSVSDPEYDSREHEVFIHASAPVQDETGRIRGVAIVRTTFAPIDHLAAADRNFATHGEFGILMDEHGIRLSAPRDLALRFVPLAPLPRHVQEALIAEQRFGAGTADLLAQAQHNELLVAGAHELLTSAAANPQLNAALPGVGASFASLVPLDQKHWVYGVFASEEAVFATLRAQMRWQLISAAAAALVALALAFVVPLASLILCFAVAAYYLLPDRADALAER
jgi:hypothetical protein